RSAAIQGGVSPGDAAPGRGRRAGYSVPAATQAVLGSGDDLPEMFAQGAGLALRQRAGAGRRSAPVPGWPADPGAAGRTSRTALALVPADPGCGLAVSLGAQPGRGPGGRLDDGGTVAKGIARRGPPPA